MKNIYILPLLLLFFASCSVDDSADLLTQEPVNALTLTSEELARIGETGQSLISPDCFKVLSAHINLNVSAGLNNPVINFVGDAPIGTSARLGYIVRVEVVALSDCDDLNSPTGSVIILGNNTVFNNVGTIDPVVSALPSQLPVCYKWRITYERVGAIITSCKSYSQWYEAPLF